MTPEQQAAETFARVLPHLTPEEVPVRLAEVMGALVSREVQRERERCARVCAGLAESYQVRDDADSASALIAAAGLLRTRPGLDCCELIGPATDIDLPRYQMPDRDGLWTYRHTDGSLYYCTASESGDVLTWSRTPPQGDWAGVWKCMEDDENGSAAGHDLGGEQ